MQYTRREWIQTSGAALTLACLKGTPLLAASAPLAASTLPIRVGQEVTWAELEAFFNARCRKVPDWQHSASCSRWYYGSKLYIEYPSSDRAATFVRSRYIEGGPLWYCAFLDEQLL
jgi:hypothetical protein